MLRNGRSSGRICQFAGFLNEVLSLNAQEYELAAPSGVRYLLLNEVLSLNAQEFDAVRGIKDKKDPQ